MEFEMLDEILNFLPTDITKIIYEYYNECSCYNRHYCDSCYILELFYWEKSLLNKQKTE